VEKLEQLSLRGYGNFAIKLDLRRRAKHDEQDNCKTS
jgi:hypothetical protein